MMMSNQVFVLLFIAYIEAIVEIKQGKLCGIVEKSVLSKKEYHSFLGIPYAKPPLGELRFKPPEPADGWNDIKNASQEGNRCFQNNVYMPSEYIGSEDCLYLNIYTPEEPRSNVNKAVMVFIHGGGFTTGSGSSQSYSPDFLIERDVIVVTMNYRLHVFGFLNLELPDANGNYGLKDQLMALKWIKENIQEFGGNPNAITIFGESAGASAVHYHLISPASRGLFNRGIIQSGSSFSAWSYTDEHLETAFKFGKLLGFHGNTTDELLIFLKQQGPKELTQANNKLLADIKHEKPGATQHALFVPSVEKYKEDAFVPDTPTELLKNPALVPIIAGYNNKEGILIFPLTSSNLVSEIQNDNSYLVKYNLDGINDDNLQNVTQMVKQFYFGEKDIGNETLSEFVDVYTDLFFKSFYSSVNPMIKSEQPVYLYEFTYDGKRNMLKNFIRMKMNIQIEGGAAHGDDLGYIFYQRFTSPSIDPNDRKVIENITKLWTNFAKTGSPNDDSEGVRWLPTTSTKPCYLEINEEFKLVDGRINEKRVKFWEEITEYMKST